MPSMESFNSCQMENVDSQGTKEQASSADGESNGDEKSGPPGI